jgi:hypothetical protein
VAAQAPVPAKKSSDIKSTQASLLITEIKDGVVVMHDGSLRAVILTSAINFDLMSQQEQDSVEYSFQSFLNSLHFPIQIVVKSQKIDLDAYIEDLSKRRDGQDNPLLANLMDDYIANIKGLIEEVNIMDKQFFVVVPHFPTVSPTRANIVTGLSTSFKPSPVVTMSAPEFEGSKNELAQRVQLVSAGLSQMGLRAIPLNTQELIDLFYASYNPDVAANQKLIDASQFQTAAVLRGNPAAKPTDTTQTASVASAASSQVYGTAAPSQVINPAPPPAPAPIAAPAPLPVASAPEPVIAPATAAPADAPVAAVPNIAEPVIVAPTEMPMPTALPVAPTAPPMGSEGLPQNPLASPNASGTMQANSTATPTNPNITRGPQL